MFSITVDVDFKGIQLAVISYLYIFFKKPIHKKKYVNIYIYIYHII